MLFLNLQLGVELPVHYTTAKTELSSEKHHKNIRYKDLCKDALNKPVDLDNEAVSLKHLAGI